MRKKFNFNEFFWFMILVGFSLYIYNLLATKTLGYFIHPNMFKYVRFTFIVFVFLSLYQLTRIFTSYNSKNFKKGYIIFIIPLLMGIIINPRGLDAEAAENRGLIFVQESKFKDSVIANINKEEKIELKENNFYKSFESISHNVEEYIGRNIIFEGFVSKDKSLPSNQFIVGRMLLNCCAADGQVAGFICEYREEVNFNNNQWVKITGIIDVDNIKGVKKPVIKIINLEEIKEPENKYIYP